MKSTQKMGYVNSILYIIFSITFCFYKYGDAAKNVLIPGDELNSLDSNSILVSDSGLFTLGFFTISTTNLTYLGIWYTNEKEGQELWIANRNKPFVGSGVLRMDDVSGNLKVVNARDGTSFFVVCNNQAVVGSSGNTKRAVLENTGNFVVYDISKDGNRTIWQSFDYPTHALIPGMKLGYNLTTKQNWELTSWADQDAPGSGAFTMRLERYQNSPQLLIYRREELYWASGPWENGLFPFLPLHSGQINGSYPYRRLEMGRVGYPFNLISDASGMYLTVQAVGSFGALSTLLQLSREGQFSDKGNSFSATPRFCYGGDDILQLGCVVSAFPSCRAQLDSNYEWDNAYYISGPTTYVNNSSISLGDCMERCWNDCTCTGCMTDINGTGCITWTDKPMYGDYSGRVYVLNSYPPKKRIWRRLIFTAFLLTCVYTTIFCYARIRRRFLKGKENKRRNDIIQQLTDSNSFNYGDELERGIQGAPDVKIFSLKAVLIATNDFSNDNKLGQGGYGPVYKGELSDGRKIAIKRLSKASGQGILEFKSELILISKLQHTNLVRLYGCCIHQEERMLIYEFMPNKSLDFFLFDADKNKKIDWRTRFKIIEGIAQGLLYLHKYSRMRVIHRDLKASNVLLDENMNPKIADFGMARIFQQDVSEATTNRVVGTYGYMAPEYTMHGTFSFKSDTFSFGVLILEIVSGKKNSSFHSLLKYAWELWRREATLELKEKTFDKFYDVKQILRTIQIGLLCVQENPKNRPTMSEVVSMLNNEIAELPIPKKPTFFMHPDEFQPSRSTEHSSDGNIQGSINGLTITTMEAK